MKPEQSGVNGKPFAPQKGANGKAKATPNQSRSGSALEQLDAEGVMPGEYLFQGHTVRTVTIRGVMWFVMTDICAALNYVTPAKVLG